MNSEEPANLVRAHRVISAASSPPAVIDDVVELTYDERHRRRIRMTSAKGRAFLLDLPKAIALAEGDVLVLEDGSAVRVRATPEPVVDIHADSAHRLTVIAWHVGNRHWPMQVLEKGLRIRFDPVLVSMIEGLGGNVTEHDAPFQPEGGAYAHEH